MKVKVTNTCDFFGVSRWYLFPTKTHKTCTCTRCKRKTLFRAKVFTDKVIQKRTMCPKCFYRWVVSINEKIGNKVEIA